MKANLHPQNYEATVSCSCGNQFTVTSTKKSMYVDLCYNCHPFYTGQQRFVDSASRIDKFKQKMAHAQPIKKKYEEKKEEAAPMTLKEMLQALKKN